MKSSRGFSLIEVVISIFIIGVMLVLLHAVSQNSVLVRSAKNRGIALAVARDKVESLRIGGYASLPQSGTFSNSLMSTLPPGATTTLTVSAYNAKTTQVAVGVTWTELGSTASSTVSLQTLITQTGGLP